MALQAAFKQFLASPNASLLAENASIHYITTLVTYHGPAEIIKHLNSQSRQLQKKKEEFLDIVEGQSALATEVETTIEFLTSGGAYLPGLDDNFLADRTVTFPIVRFPPQGSGFRHANVYLHRFTLSASTRMERSPRSARTGIKDRSSS
jgi:hypothetical protein